MNLLSKIIPLCSICGAPIIGAYLIDAYGNKVCYHHKDQFHYCLSCGRICDSEAFKQSKSVYICSDCFENIPSDEECSRIVQHIRSRYIDLPIGIIPAFTLIRVPIQKWQKDSKSVGVAVRDESGYSIRVVDCLSKTAFAEVMAHELLHLWLFDHGLSPSKRITEGFCNLGSFEILRGIQTEKAKAKIDSILSNPDSIYGDGFRLVKKEFDSSGWTGVIERVKRHCA